MELTLKDRKAINNGKYTLPKFEDGFSQRFDDAFKNWRMPDAAQLAVRMQADVPKIEFNKKLPSVLPDITKDYVQQQALDKSLNTAQSIGGAIQSGTSFAGALVDAFTTDASVDKFIADAGTSEGSIGGIKYQRINPFKDGKLPEYSNGLGTVLNTAGSGASFGASVGTLVPGIGTGIGALAGGLIGGIAGGIGSLISGNKEEEIKDEARQKRLVINQFNSDSALSKYLQMKEQEDLSRPTYKGGKLPLLDSAFGMIKGEPNAKVDEGEWMINTITGDAHKVRRGAGDNALAYVRPEDTILSKKRGAADYFEQTGDLIGAMSMNKKQYSCGKLPKLKNGWLPNAITSGLSGLVGLGQYLSAKNDDVKNPNTYVSNPYEGTALRGLAGLQYDPYPIVNSMKDRQAYFNYGLTNSGGLSGAQKYLGRIANANNMYKATADMLAGLQERNIGLRSNYYNTMANLGVQQAQRRQSANQYDLDYYSKAHAARQQGMNAGLYNMMNAAQNWAANQFKYDQFMRTLRLYQQDLNNKA